MYGKYLFVLAAHFTCTALVLKCLGAIFPCCITGLYFSVGNFISFVLVAMATFPFTAKKHLNDKLQPENRAVLITGCDTGIGHHLAKRLDSLGFHVFASCLNPSGSGAKELAESCSKRLQILALDVTKDESVKIAFEFVKENLGTSELWAVVNNAGIYRGIALELSSLEDFKETLDVNVLGQVRVTKAFLPLLRQSRGRVVNISGVDARASVPYKSAYVMSGYAAAGFNDCLRQELLVWGIRVISVEPEIFETELTKIDRIKQTIESSLQSADENIKADYGEEFLNKSKIYTELFLHLASSKVSKVVDDLEDAISKEHPKIIYQSSRNCFAGTIYYTYRCLPHIARDLVIKFILYLVGFPKPAEAHNVS